MTNNQLTRYLKKGLTTRAIRREFFYVRLVPGNLQYDVLGHLNPDTVVNDIKEAGFRAKNKNRLKNKQRVQETRLFEYHDAENDLRFELTFFWEKPLNNGTVLDTFCLMLKTPDEEEWYIAGRQKELCAYLPRLIASWPVWEKEWSAIAARIPALRKEVEVGANTIDALINCMLKGSGLLYNKYIYHGETYLKIKLPHHRYLEIKLHPGMDMTHAANISALIEKITATMDEAGPLNITVKNTTSTIAWQQSPPDTLQKA